MSRISWPRAQRGSKDTGAAGTPRPREGLSLWSTPLPTGWRRPPSRGVGPRVLCTLSWVDGLGGEVWGGVGLRPCRLPACPAPLLASEPAARLPALAAHTDIPSAQAGLHRPGLRRPPRNSPSFVLTGCTAFLLSVLQTMRVNIGTSPSNRGAGSAAPCWPGSCTCGRRLGGGGAAVGSPRARGSGLCFPEGGSTSPSHFLTQGLALPPFRVFLLGHRHSGRAPQSLFCKPGLCAQPGRGLREPGREVAVPPCPLPRGWLPASRL